MEHAKLVAAVVAVRALNKWAPRIPTMRSCPPELAGLCYRAQTITEDTTYGELLEIADDFQKFAAWFLPNDGAVN